MTFGPEHYQVADVDVLIERLGEVEGQVRELLGLAELDKARIAQLERVCEVALDLNHALNEVLDHPLGFSALAARRKATDALLRHAVAVAGLETPSK
jgi:hypothetical protein